MFKEFKKSISALLYQRLTSPFWGSFLISWIISNWKIVYFTLFVSSDSIDANKYDYLISNFPINIYNFLWFPLLYSIIIILITPFLSNGAFWLSIRFKNWKRIQKNLVENKVALSIEESIVLKDEINNQEEKFKKLTDTKDDELLKKSSALISLEKERMTYLNKIETLTAEKDKLYDKYIIETNKNNFINTFKGVWYYEIGFGEKRLFKIWNRNQIEFMDTNMKFQIHTIYRYKNSSMKLYLDPIEKSFDNDDDWEIKILKLERSNDENSFKGKEITIAKGHKVKEMTIRLIKG